MRLKPADALADDSDIKLSDHVRKGILKGNGGTIADDVDARIPRLSADQEEDKELDELLARLLSDEVLS
jgi:hypothetical protein